MSDLFNQPIMQVMDAMDECVLGLDLDGRCQYANQSALNLLRADMAALLGQPVDDIVRRPDPRDLPPWPICLERLRDPNRAPMVSEIENVLRLDGQPVSVEIGVRGLHQDGATVGFVISFDDLTERNRQSKAFHNSVRSFRSLFDSVADPIFFLSRQGRVLDANQGVQRLFGFSAQEFHGKSIDNIYVPDRHEAGLLSNAVTEVFKGKSQHIEFWARNRKGNIFPADVYMYPSSYFSQPVAMVMVHDITVRKRYEEAILKSRDQAEGSSRMKSQFISNMSHEFRTPMNAILGMGQLMQESELDEEQHGYMQEIMTGAQNLLGILNSVIDLAKYENGQHQANDHEFELNSLLDDAARLYRKAGQEKGLALRIDTDPEFTDFFSGDVEGLSKVLRHLLDNACKFTDSGEIVLSARIVEDSTAVAGEAAKQADGEDDAKANTRRVRFSIRDTGVGIPEKDRERIFEPFVQGDGSATRKHGGTGLGLSIANLIVASMGGTLHLQSEVGQGSEFYFIVEQKIVVW